MKQLWLTLFIFITIQHHNLREENATRFNMSTCQLTFYVETCPVSGCTNKATKQRAQCEPPQCRVTKWKSKFWFSSLSLQPAGDPRSHQPERLGIAHIHPSLLLSQKCDDFTTSLLLQRLGASLTKVTAFDRQGKLTRKRRTFYFILSQI